MALGCTACRSLVLGLAFPGLVLIRELVAIDEWVGGIVFSNHMFYCLIAGVARLPLQFGYRWTVNRTESGLGSAGFRAGLGLSLLILALNVTQGFIEPLKSEETKVWLTAVAFARGGLWLLVALAGLGLLVSALRRRSAPTGK